MVLIILSHNLRFDAIASVCLIINLFVRVYCTRALVDLEVCKAASCFIPSHFSSSFSYTINRHRYPSLINLTYHVWSWPLTYRQMAKGMLLERDRLDVPTNEFTIWGYWSRPDLSKAKWNPRHWSQLIDATERLSTPYPATEMNIPGQRYTIGSG